MEANTVMPWGKKPCCSGCAEKAVGMAAGGAVNKVSITPEMRNRAARLFADGGAARTDTGAADPEYTSIWPGSEYSTLGNIGGMLWRPFLRREVLKEEETRRVGDDTIEINPETGMQEVMSTIQTFPGEYGPIELADWPSSMDIMNFGIENWLKAKAFLSTPEGREEALDIAQQLPSQAIEGAQDYMTQQVGMANRGLQETYDPATGEIKDFNIPLIAAEIMAGSLSRPPVQLAGNEFLAGMAVKGKGGTFERHKQGTFLERVNPAYPSADAGTPHIELQPDYQTPDSLDELLQEYRLAFQEKGMNEADIDHIVNRADQYYTTDFGTAQDPIKRAILEGKIEPGGKGLRANRNMAELTLRPYLIDAAQRDHQRMRTLDNMQEQINTFTSTRRRPLGLPQGLHLGFESAEDLARFRDMEANYNAQIETFGNRPTLATPSDAMRDFEDAYDQSVGLRSYLYYPENISPGEKLSYGEQQRLIDEARLQRRQQIEKEGGINTGLNYEGSGFSLEDPRRRYDISALSQKEQQPIKWAIANQEPVWEMDPGHFDSRGLGFLMPRAVADRVQAIGEDRGMETFRKGQGRTFPEILTMPVKEGFDRLTREVQNKGLNLHRAASFDMDLPLREALVPEKWLLTEEGFVEPTGIRDTYMNDEWVRLATPEAAQLEGFLMNHSVGTYAEPGTRYNAGGREGFLSGKARVFSLRDSNTGQPKVTMDVSYRWPDEPSMWSIYEYNNAPLSLENYNQVFKLLEEYNIDPLDTLERPYNIWKENNNTDFSQLEN